MTTTMRDVAKAAGVSVATVSHVVNDKPGARIGDDARRRVQEAIVALGYRPNALAKTLSEGSSRFIGLVADAIATTPFAGQIIHGAQDEAWRHGFVLLVANTEGNAAAENDAIGGASGTAEAISPATGAGAPATVPDTTFCGAATCSAPTSSVSRPTASTGPAHERREVAASGRVVSESVDRSTVGRVAVAMRKVPATTARLRAAPTPRRIRRAVVTRPTFLRARPAPR